MSKKLEFPSINTRPDGLLHNIARDHAGTYENVLVIGITDEGHLIMHMAEIDPAFLSMAAIEAHDLARAALNDDLVPV